MRYVAFLTAALLAGCQSYRPTPLDLAAHGAAWQSRDPASPDVAAYARELASARAAEPAFDPADGFSLNEAHVVALYFNPDVRAARLKARVPAASAAEAGRWQDPTLRIDAERIIQSVSHPWVIGGMLELTLPLSGTPGLERAKSLAQADAAWTTALLEEQRVLTDLDKAWLELHQLQRRSELIDGFVKDLDVFVKQAEQLQKAGEMSPLEAGLLKIERARKQAELRSLVARRTEQEIGVKSLMGLTPEAAVQLLPSLPAAFADSGTTAQERRERLVALHPKLLHARQQYAVAERSLELEIRRQYPDLTLGGGFGRDEGTSRILGGLGIPIPIFNANRQAIAEATAERNAARAAAEAEYENLIAALARAEAALAASDVHRQVLERDVAPLIDQQLQSARDLGRLGNINPVAIFESLVIAHDTRLEILDAVGTRAAAVNQINALLRPVPGVEMQMREKQ
ncbi:TolC family protein [Humisphaera borealis]|uniref:TolC family protein n=1 Tax=Humisphaera borealis TaxID=2807512 RepID=A0A7M2X0Q6_9BACT|nr:TolC family protein [Humisphaera borealis]QOV90691.1 TolC family protein [Humisphaera borealis]